VSLSLRLLHTTCFGLRRPSSGVSIALETVALLYLLFSSWTRDKKKVNTRIAAVFYAILTPHDGQRRPKHVACRRRSESDTQLVIQVLKFVLYFMNEF
jgi:hypothetical protein